MAEAITPSIGERRRPGWIAVLLLLSAAALFVSLGRWQLDRGAAQRILESEATAALSMPVMDLSTSAVYVADAWRHARAEGIYDPAQQFYLEGRQHQGRNGYHVVTPLRLVGTRRYVLVNRGWAPFGAGAVSVPAGRVQVSGVLTRPQLPPLRLGEIRGATRPYLDPQEYGRETGRAVAPLILNAEQGDGELIPVNVTVNSKQGMHSGYALQWFAFAAVALVAAAVVVTGQVRHGR